ncbi:MAG: DNA-3-methyladenine glycosylase [Acidobacteriota bacterium]
MPRAFYDRPAEVVARALLGKMLVHGAAQARIVETEAYLGLRDRAAHAWRGPTPRTKVLFGQPGHAYVYLIYGMYECLNIVAEGEGSPGCVLIRALQPVAGVVAMRRRRPAAHRDEDLANGPGKLTLAMGITRRDNGADVTRGRLTVCESSVEGFEVSVSARVGIQHNIDWPLRFFIAGNACVSRAR